jgi:hypothetical protein
MLDSEFCQKSSKFWARKRTRKGLCQTAFEHYGLTAWSPTFPASIHAQVPFLENHAEFLQLPHIGKPGQLFTKHSPR